MERFGRFEEPAVFDTSSLIFLDLLGYIPLLEQLYQVIVPEAVSEEFAWRNIEEDLRLLEEAGMRISPDLRRRVIEAGRQDEGR